MGYSLGPRVNTSVTAVQELLGRAGGRGGTEVGGDHGRGHGGGVDGAGVDVQREHPGVGLGATVGWVSSNEEETDGRQPGEDESSPVEDCLQVLDPFWGEGMEGIGFQVRQRVGRGSGNGGEGAIVEPGANSLREVGGEEVLVMGNFLEMLPLAKFAHGVEAALSIEMVVEGFVFRHADAGRDVGFDMREQPPPPVSPFHSKGVVVQAGARGSHGGEDPRGDGDEGVVVVLDGDLGCVAVSVLSQVDL